MNDDQDAADTTEIAHVFELIETETGTHCLKIVREPPKEKLTFGQRVADKISAFGGSWTFIFIFLGCLSTWMFVNSHVTKPYDPFPYILLNLFLSMLAAIQAPIIMMSSNRHNQKDRFHAKFDYRINLKAELEIEELHKKLNKIQEKLDKLK
jgi:uncharacterized membrane protein